MKFGTLLRKTRENAGLNQEELAEILHISRSTISKLENDKAKLECSMAIQWARATSAQEVMAAVICGIDVAKVTQVVEVITTLIGGFILWV